MKRKTITFLFVVIVSTGFCKAEQKYNCDNPQGGYETGYCSGLKYKKADKELNIAYKKLKSKLNKKEQKLLLNAQRGWIKLKENHCELDNFENRGTTGWQTYLNECWEKYTLQRTKELNKMSRLKSALEEPTY